MSFPNSAERAGWFAQQYERVEADYDPTDAEQGGLAAAWAESRAYNTNPPAWPTPRPTRCQCPDCTERRNA